MADKVEQELAAGLEDAMGVRAMAEKLAPRPDKVDFSQRNPQPPLAAHLTPPAVSIEQRLVTIEKTIGEIRQMMAHLKGMIG